MLMRLPADDCNADRAGFERDRDSQRLPGAVDEVALLSHPPEQPVRGDRDGSNHKKAGLNLGVGCRGRNAARDR